MKKGEFAVFHCSKCGKVLSRDSKWYHDRVYIYSYCSKTDRMARCYRLQDKKCSKCGKIKPPSEYYKLHKGQPGTSSYCKKCYTIANRTEHRRKYNRKWLKEHKYGTIGIPRLRRNAIASVGTAVRKGKLLRLPCSVCGKTKVQGHHPDYNKPLEVVWLCEKHHRELHKKST